jgi:hypothetical protein
LVWLRYCCHQVCEPFVGYVLVLLCVQQTNKQTKVYVHDYML